jgi:hypothetical protein
VFQEVLYHAVAFILYLVAGIVLLVEIKNHDRYDYYKAYLAAAVSMWHDHHSYFCEADIVSNKFKELESFVHYFFSYCTTANIQDQLTDSRHGAGSFLRICESQSK